MIAHPSTGAARLIRVAILVALGINVLGCDLVRTAPPASPAAASRSAAPSGATPSAISKPDLVGHNYVLSLIAAFREDPLVTHVVQTGKATAKQGGKTENVTVFMTMDISGRELKQHLSITTGGTTKKSDLTVVGKSAYSRAGSGAWKKAPRNGVEKAISETIANLRMIDDPADLRWLGPETVDKQPLQHLTAAQTIPYEIGTGATGQYDRFDIWITEDGTPVLVKAAYNATMPGGISIKGTTEFRFSKFGGPIKIVAPKTK